jgi:isopenicillin-N N-acyltransferase-like protein
MDLPRVVTVSGTPAECGAAYGAATRELTNANLAAYRRRFRDQAGLDRAEVHAAGTRFRAATLAHHPRIAAMLDGLAEGAGAPAAEIYALNARTELLYGHPDPQPEGCTAIGVLGTHTATGHLLLAQNWDWHPDQRGAILLLHTTDERGHTVLTLAEAGMLAKAGVNSAGLGQCLTMLACDRDGLGATGSPGLPYHVLARATLEADSLGWALRMACRSPRNASINLLLGQAGDGPAGGELIDLELVPGDVGWLHPVDGMITHANHLETGLPVFDIQKEWGGSSLFRAARARRLLAEAVAAGKTTTDQRAELLADHASVPHAICRHPDSRLPPLEQSETVCSVLLDLDSRRLGFAAGPPCQHPYRWFALGTGGEAAVTGFG